MRDERRCSEAARETECEPLTTAERAELVRLRTQVEELRKTI